MRFPALGGLPLKAEDTVFAGPQIIRATGASWTGVWDEDSATAARLRSFRTQIGSLEEQADRNSPVQAPAPEVSTVTLDPSSHIQHTIPDPRAAGNLF